LQPSKLKISLHKDEVKVPSSLPEKLQELYAVSLASQCHSTLSSHPRIGGIHLVEQLSPQHRNEGRAFILCNLNLEKHLHTEKGGISGSVVEMAVSLY
jgi:hypothetical protein